MTDLLMVHCPLGGGHQAAAAATAEAARRQGLSVVVIDLFSLAPRWFTDLYLSGHRWGQGVLPALFGSMYDATNRVGGGLEPVRHLIEREMFRQLRELVRQHHPRAIIATHHLPLVVLGADRARGELGVPLYAVVTDYVAHGFWVEPGVDGYLVATRDVARDLERHGVSSKLISVTGIPVREEFEFAPAVTSHVRTRVLVTSGGFGVGPLRSIVRSFAGIPNIELNVVCGSSKDTRARIERDARWVGLSVNALGFVSNMPELMANADVIVGKAGGLTVSEALTAGRAMIFVGTVPGMESGNESHVVRAGAGVTCKKDYVGQTVESFAPLLPAMGRAARTIVQHHSAARIISTVFSQAELSEATSAA